MYLRSVDLTIKFRDKLIEHFISWFLDWRVKISFEIYNERHLNLLFVFRNAMTRHLWDDNFPARGVQNSFDNANFVCVS